MNSAAHKEISQTRKSWNKKINILIRSVQFSRQRHGDFNLRTSSWTPSKSPQRRHSTVHTHTHTHTQTHAQSDTEQRRECVCAHARKGNRFSVRLRKLTPKNTYKKTMMMMLSIGPPVSNKKRGAILNFRATPAQKRKSIIPARPSPGMFLIYDIFMLMAFACASVSVSVHECVCMCVFMGTCMCVCVSGDLGGSFINLMNSLQMAAGAF